MRLAVYISGGILLWLGVYGYLKTRSSVGSSPIPGTRSDFAFQTCGLLGHVALLAYLITMLTVFKWWLVPAFTIAGGSLIAIIFSRLRAVGPGVAIVCVPFGVAVAAIALAL